MGCRVPVGDRRGCRVEVRKSAQLGLDHSIDEVVADALVCVDTEGTGRDEGIMEAPPLVGICRLPVHGQIGEGHGSYGVDAGQ